MACSFEAENSICTHLLHICKSMQANVILHNQYAWAQRTSIFSLGCIGGLAGWRKEKDTALDSQDGCSKKEVENPASSIFVSSKWVYGSPTSTICNFLASHLMVDGSRSTSFKFLLLKVGTKTNIHCGRFSPGSEIPPFQLLPTWPLSNLPIVA